ncbi:MAG: LptA/OstA family protein [SAR324 cluster bacterium]|nr:LptA/OstA family protein [SAR324 cluster bacterium]
MAERRFLFFSISRIFLLAILAIFLNGVTLFFMEAPAVYAKSRYLINRNTLDHLNREGLPEKLVQSMAPLLEKVFPSREAFLKVLGELEVPPRAPLETDIILRYSAMDQITIQAETFSSDQISRESIFKGNVQGKIPRENILFSTAKLRMLIGEFNSYERLIGEGGIRVEQWDREVRGDYLNYTRVFDNNSQDMQNPTPDDETLKLEGSVQISAAQGKARSSTLFLDLLNQEAVLEGKSAKGSERVRIEAYPDRLSKGAEGQTTTDPSTSPAREIVVQAARASLENKKRRIILEGAVEMQRMPEDFFLSSGILQLLYDEEQMLTEANARQSVCIEQPGRVARADLARVDELKQTIRLEGNAEVDSGQYNLQGSQINLFLDVNRGVAQGDGNAPIQMKMKMGGEFTPAFRCR